MWKGRAEGTTHWAGRRLRKLLELYPQQAGLAVGLDQLLNLPGLSFPPARCRGCKALQAQVVRGLALS